jgi:hypothetical protein
MANHIVRKLKKKEVVHHRNGDPKDNRLSNLQLFTSHGEHISRELTGRKRKPFSKEHRANISKSLIGTARATGKRSKESRERMRAAQLKYWSRKRGGSV